MSERGFMDVMKEALAEIAPALKTMGAEIGAEMSRLGTQGTMELASAVFGNGAFVPYGPGQYTPTPEVGKESPEPEVQKPAPVQEQQQERAGREM